LYDLHLEKKWSIKDEGDRWGSITVIIKIPLSTEMAKSWTFYSSTGR
jgi:hypothetical protein